MTFPLKYGSRGEEVRMLQGYLNQRLPFPVAALVQDGIWGPNTEDAARQVLNTNQVDESFFRVLFPAYAPSFPSPSRPSTPPAGSSTPIDQMDGDQVVRFLATNDAKVRDELLALREGFLRMKAKGLQVDPQLQELRAIADRYNARQRKLKSHPAISFANYANEAYDWMAQQWDNLVSGVGAIQIPIGAAVVVVAVAAAGTALYYTFRGDAKMSVQDLEQAIPALKAVQRQIDPQLYQELTAQIQDVANKNNFPIIPAALLGVALILLLK